MRMRRWSFNGYFGTWYQVCVTMICQLKKCLKRQYKITKTYKNAHLIVTLNPPPQNTMVDWKTAQILRNKLKENQRRSDRKQIQLLWQFRAYQEESKRARGSGRTGNDNVLFKGPVLLIVSPFSHSTP